MTTEVVENAFLGGALRILQPAKGYRAGVDPVLLASAVPAKSGQSVLELGTGVGTAALCLGHRVAGLELTGVEVQPDIAALARQNGQLNQIGFDVITADLASLPADLNQRRFDHVIANPPYFVRNKGNASSNFARETAMGEATPLAKWLEVAGKRVAPKGMVTLIHRAERLRDILLGLPQHLGSIQVQPLQARIGRDAHLLILRAKHSGRAPLRLHAAITLHQGLEHLADAEDYSADISSVLRQGAALSIPE